MSDRSVSKQRGFIGLEPHSSASSEETPPPLHYWSKQLRIGRLFPLSQTLDAEPPVTGVALVNVLLGDNYKRNSDIPVAAMKSTSPLGKLIGAWPLDKLCKDLATKNSFPGPHTFGRARQLVERPDKDIKECLLQGFFESQLNFLLAIKFWDFRGTKRLWRNFKGYVQIHCSGVDPFPISAVAARTLEMCAELERHSLTYSRNLEKYREHGMAWMDAIKPPISMHL